MAHDSYRNKEHLNLLSEAWRKWQKLSDFWITFSWPPTTTKDLKRARDQLERFIVKYIANPKRRWKKGASLEWFVACEHYREGTRPHIHVLLRHVAGEIPNLNDIADGWRLWIKWDNPQAVHIQPDNGSEHTYGYCLGHHHPDHYGPGAVDRRRTAVKRKACESGIADKSLLEGAKRLKWLASWV